MSKKKPSKVPKKRNLAAKQSINQKAPVFKDKRKGTRGTINRKDISYGRDDFRHGDGK